MRRLADTIYHRRNQWYILAAVVSVGVGLSAILLFDNRTRRNGHSNTPAHGEVIGSPASRNVMPEIATRARLEEEPSLAAPSLSQLNQGPSVASIEALAGTDFLNALTLALAEADPQLQHDRLRAALRRWATVDPDAAAQWLLEHPATPADSAWGAIFEGASQHPERAIALAQSLSRKNPDQTRDYGYALIFALNKVAGFEQAASYAVADSSRWQPDLIIAAYHDWGRHQPEAALVFAINLPAPTRETAIQSVLSGWSREDPEGLADAALNFPDGAEKKSALIKAVRAWVIKDPEKARDWIMAHDAALPAAEVALRED